MSSASISGAISGIDTASLITSLMNVESQPQTNIKTKQTAAQAAADAYTSVIKSLKSLSTQSAALAKTSTWQGSSVTSSSTSVTATTTGNATGSITFDVTKVAAAHTLVSAGSVASTSAVVVPSGDLEVFDKDGVSKGTIDVGGGTMAEVVAGINGSSLGLRAAAVQTEPGKYRLQVTSATSGAAATFSLGGLDGFTATSPATSSTINVLTAGADAVLTIGKDPLTQYTVNSASNTFADLVPGLSFTVSKVESNVTVDAKLDGSAVATQIKSMVDATNTILTQLTAATAYDFTTKTGAALYGDNSIKGLQQSILSTVSGSNTPGIQLTRDGKLTFDNDAFIKAFQANPTGTAAAYGATSSFTPNTGVLSKAAMVLSTDATKAGTYAIGVTANAKAETWTAPTATMTAGQVITLTKGSVNASYTVLGTETPAELATAISSTATSAGIAVGASYDGSSNLVFTAANVGSAAAFSVTAPSALKTVTGSDMVGSIDGEAATAIGNRLSLSSGTSSANGLSVNVDVSDAAIATAASSFNGVIGNFTFSQGLAGKLSNLLSTATATSTGSLTQAQQSRVDDVKDFQDQIDAWDIRLAARRATLTRQFTAMETALASLKSSSSAITNLLATSSSSSSS